MDERSKKGLANILTLVGVCLVVGSIVMSIIFGLDKNVGKLFLISLVGTVLIFTANYMRDGYIKFFN